MKNMWMIRGDAGRLYDDFREQKIAAIGWSQIAEQATPGVSRQALTHAYLAAEPGIKEGTAISGASQVFRFVNEVKEDDDVVTYSPATRTYLVGKFKSPSQYNAGGAENGMALIRSVEWKMEEVDRDLLSIASKNSLGSTLTVFKVPDFARQELLALAAGKPSTINPVLEKLNDEQLDDPLKGLSDIAFERIKDQINGLGWEEMQELVAGILRAMGYKTTVSSVGADRGKDILASPDGFGFQQPRIVVEVKHRNGRISSPQIRSFLGGRHKDDRGLFVSTGGFTKDAYYEADRANVPLMLWTLEELARALMDNYQDTDMATKQLVPLKYFFVPA